MTGAFFFEKIAQLDWDKFQQFFKMNDEELRKLSESFSIAYQEHASYQAKSWIQPEPVDWMGT